MFLPPSEKIDQSKFLNCYDQFRKDYLEFKDKDYFFDYSHAQSLTFNKIENAHNVVLPKSTGYFWQVCPIIFNKNIIPIVSKDVQESFTANILMSMSVLPVLAVFSILKPNSDIDPHIDTDEHIADLSYPNSVVKYHFSLDIPNDGECALIVGNTKRILNNNDLNCFDERTTHYAYNHSNSERGVLIVSYIRKEIY